MSKKAARSVIAYLQSVLILPGSSRKRETVFIVNHRRATTPIAISSSATENPAEERVCAIAR